MRPRAIQEVPGLGQDASPLELPIQFASTIVAVSKEETDKEIEKSGSLKGALSMLRRSQDGRVQVVSVASRARLLALQNPIQTGGRNVNYLGNDARKGIW